MSSSAFLPAVQPYVLTKLGKSKKQRYLSLTTTSAPGPSQGPVTLIIPSTADSMPSVPASDATTSIQTRYRYCERSM